MWKANGKTTTLSLFLQSLFPKTDVLEEAVDLSYDRLLMMKSALWNAVLVDLHKTKRWNKQVASDVSILSGLHIYTVLFII
jgi:hypothetical protein